MRHLSHFLVLAVTTTALPYCSALCNTYSNVNIIRLNTLYIKVKSQYSRTI